MPALFYMFAYNLSNVRCFILFALGNVHLYLITFAVVGPQSLAFALSIVLDDAVGGVKNIGRGSVVLFQTNSFCFRVNFLKLQNILNRCSTEAINALVVITHNAYILLWTSQQANQFKLCNTGILIFVHQ